MIGMTPAMLKNRGPCSWDGPCTVREPSRELELDHRGDCGERDRNPSGYRCHTLEQPAGRYGIVIAPPKRCHPARFLPTVELIDQIGPSSGDHRGTTRRQAHGRIIAPVRCNTKLSTGLRLEALRAG